jgi:hypothetical protein
MQFGKSFDCGTVIIVFAKESPVLSISHKPTIPFLFFDKSYRTVLGNILSSMFEYHRLKVLIYQKKSSGFRKEFQAPLSPPPSLDNKAKLRFIADPYKKAAPPTGEGATV